MEYSQEAITRRLAYVVYQEFGKAGLENDTDSNWQVAEGIIKRIIDGIYTSNEWASFLSREDIRALLTLREEKNKSGRPPHSNTRSG